MSRRLYTLEQAKAELAHVYPSLEVTEVDEYLVIGVFGQFKITIVVEDDQFLVEMVVDERDTDVLGDPISLNTFICDSAPMGVNQVLRKFERYFSGVSRNAGKLDAMTFRNKKKINQPPLITHEQRERIKQLIAEGFEFDGLTYEEASAFIEEVG